MLIDDAMPEFDATRVERRVIDAEPLVVYAAALDADFLDAVRENRAVRALFGLRSGMERLAAAVRRSPRPTAAEPETMRLKDLPGEGEWVSLGADPPREIAFASRRAFRRYWRAVSPFVGVVMRSTLRVIERRSLEPASSRPRRSTAGQSV